MNNALSSFIYDRIIRPRFINEKYLLPVVRHATNGTPGITLDFGCGTGCNSFMFQKDQYVGVDIDEGRVTYARSANRGYAFIVSPEDNLPFKDNAFDTAFICGVLHHLDNTQCRVSLRELIRVLKLKGRLIIFEPCITESSPVRNIVMKTFDKGCFIRRPNQYLALFDSLDSVEIVEYFTTPNLYNTIVLKLSL